MPDDAEREWFFYEGLKQMSKMQRNQEIDQMKHEVFVDYGDAKEEMKAEINKVFFYKITELLKGSVWIFSLAVTKRGMRVSEKFCENARA